MTPPPVRPSISVAMATYNGSRFVRQQLDSIAAQSRLPDELLVGDDGSTDDTVALVEAFAARTSIPVRLAINPRQLGSTGNFEATMLRCTGDIVALSDQDDVWRPNRLARIEAAFAARPDATYAFSDGTLIDDSSRPLPGRLWGTAFFSARDQSLFHSGCALQVLLRHNVVTGATLAVRRTAVARTLPIAAGWIHDAWMVLLLECLNPGSGVLIDEPLIAYRWHDQQQIGTTGLSPRRIRAFLNKQDDRYYELQSRNHQALHRRLLELGVSPASGPATQLQHKVAFLDLRVRMRQDRRRAAVPLALKCWAHGQYARYAGGWKSLALDLLPIVWR